MANRRPFKLEFSHIDMSDVTGEVYDCDMNPPMTSETLGKLGGELTIFMLRQAYIGQVPDAVFHTDYIINLYMIM